MGVGLALIGATALKSGLDSHEAHEQRKLAKKQMAEQERLLRILKMLETLKALMKAKCLQLEEQF